MIYEAFEMCFRKRIVKLTILLKEKSNTVAVGTYNF